MCCIQDRITDIRFSTCQADIFVGVRMFVMRLSAGQVAVIVVLMDDHDRRGAVDHRPFFLACLVDHPVVPAGPTDGEVWNIDVTGNRKKKKVTSSWTVELTPVTDRDRQAALPTFSEFNWLSHFQVPALAQQDKFVAL